jgi:hypothetical protein
MLLRFLPALAVVLCAQSSFAETLFKVDFAAGSPGDDVVTADNALPASFPGKQVTFVTKSPDVTFRLAAPGPLTRQSALLTDTGKSNGSFFLRWAEDAEDKVVSSGVLKATWTMNFVSGSGSDVSFQILRADLPKEAGRLARINVNSSGSVKIGGSTQAGAANDFPVAKNFTMNTPHTFEWTIDFSTGVQTLKVDGGALLDFSSTTRAEQNIFAAPAVAFKVEVRGDDAVVAFDDFTISTN